MTNALRVSMIISAVDRATQVINRLTNNAVTKLHTIQRGADQLARRSAAMGRDFGTAGLLIAAPLALAANEAIKFEEAMADVRKVTNLQRGTAEFSAMEKQVQRTALQMGMMPDRVAGLYASLAQGGVAVKDLEKIATVAGKVAIAFDIADPELAGEKFIKLQNALGSTIDVTEGVTNAINHLSDNSASKANQILDYMAAGGASVGRALEMSGQQSAALGSVFISMGKSGEEAATIMERLTKSVRNLDKVSGEKFNAAGGGMAGFMAVIEHGMSLPEKTRKKFAFFREFGEYGIQVEQFANNFTLLNKQVDMVSKAQNYSNSVNKEAANRMNTTGFAIKQAQANVAVMSIRLGNALLPVISQLLTTLVPIVERLSDWISRNPELTSTIVKAAAGVAGFMLIMSGGAYVVSGVATGIKHLTTVLGFIAKPMTLVTKIWQVLKPLFTVLGKIIIPILRVALTGLATAIRIITAVMIANPILAIIAAIALAAYLIYRNWDKIGPFFAKLWDSVTAKFQAVIDWFKNIGNRSMFQTGKDIIMFLGKGLASSLDFIFNPIGKIKSALNSLNILPSWLGGSKNVSVSMGSVRNMMTAPSSGIVSKSMSSITNKATGGITYAPTINLSGSASEADKKAFTEIMRNQLEEFRKQQEAWSLRNTRLSY